MEAKPAILEELIPGSSKLYFIFGGVAAEMAMPPFEFYASARIIEENKVFLRDFSQAWYQNGLPGVGGDLYAIRDFIQENIAELKPEEVFFVGNSMGGYAAILFASLVGQGTAIAFAPQTFISPLKRLRHRDRRWSKQIAGMYLRTAFKAHIWDLKVCLKPLQDETKREPRIEVFVSADDPLDYLHALRLQGLEGVRIHECPVGGHTLVKQLRDEGRLPAILAGGYLRPPVRASVQPGQGYSGRPQPGSRQRPAVGAAARRKASNPTVKPNSRSR
jgi:hypothetical protein